VPEGRVRVSTEREIAPQSIDLDGHLARILADDPYGLSGMDARLNLEPRDKDVTMDRSGRNGRRSARFHLGNEPLEGRQLLSGGFPAYVSQAELFSLLHDPAGAPAVRPNTPVLPFGTPSKQATFIDPAARIVNGYAVIVGTVDFIGPYSTLNAHGGIIKIGGGSDVLDNATIVANPTHPHTAPAPEVRIGDQVLISYGATVLGPSVIGAYGASAKPTEVGPGAMIDQATIEPGAIVSPLATIGPGVTVPSGFRVLPGKDVTTNQEASDPALGKVVKVSSSDLSDLNKMLVSNLTLAQGYNTLYQGQSATGASPGVDPSITGINNGNLSTIEGTSSQPGSPTATTAFLPPGSSPSFPSPHRGLVQASLFGFRARSTGGVLFHSRAEQVAHHLGRSNSIRGDQGQPITIGSIAGTGNGVTINAPLGGSLTIGQNFTAGNGATILGGSNVKAVIGDNVSIGNGAVVDRTSLGSGSTVGDRAYLLNSTFPAGTNIPTGAIYINNVHVGTVES
jgi:carbonic anhydrase/acetyltransferase-like protein (isoleucine patch superfamily)